MVERATRARPGAALVGEAGAQLEHHVRAVDVVEAVDDEQHPGRTEASPADVSVAAPDEAVTTAEHQAGASSSGDGDRGGLRRRAVGVRRVHRQRQAVDLQHDLRLAALVGDRHRLDRLAANRHAANGTAADRPPAPPRRARARMRCARTPGSATRRRRANDRRGRHWSGRMATTIVAVHGAFHELWGPHQVAGRWVPAIRDGLGLIGAADIDPGDITIAFYGDVFRPAAGDELTDPVLQGIAARTGLADAAAALVGEAGIEGLVKALGREQVNRTIAQLGRYFDDRCGARRGARARRRGDHRRHPAGDRPLARHRGDLRGAGGDGRPGAPRPGDHRLAARAPHGDRCRPRAGTGRRRRAGGRHPSAGGRTSPASAIRWPTGIRWPPSSPASSRSGWTTATGPTTPSRTCAPGRRRLPSLPHWRAERAIGAKQQARAGSALRSSRAAGRLRLAVPRRARRRARRHVLGCCARRIVRAA